MLTFIATDLYKIFMTMWVSFFWTQCRVQVTFTRPELRYGPRSNSLRRTSIRPNGEGALASNPHPRILVRHCSECMLLPLPRRILCDRVGFFVVRSICLSVSKVISRFHWNLVSWSDLYQSEELVRASPARRHRDTCPHGVCACTSIWQFHFTYLQFIIFM